MAKGVVKVEPEPELELGRLGPRVSRSPSPTNPVGLWMAALGSCCWVRGRLTFDGRGYPAFHRG